MEQFEMQQNRNSHSHLCTKVRGAALWRRRKHEGSLFPIMHRSMLEEMNGPQFSQASTFTKGDILHVGDVSLLLAPTRRPAPINTQLQLTSTGAHVVLLKKQWDMPHSTVSLLSDEILHQLFPTTGCLCSPLLQWLDQDWAIRKKHEEV